MSEKQEKRRAVVRMPEDYADMLDMTPPSFPHHPPMPLLSRAMQFAAFSPLTGFEEQLDESARPVDTQMELDSAQITAINETLRQLEKKIARRPAVCLVWFAHDPFKDGGEYRTLAGTLTKIDTQNRQLVFETGEKIPMCDIFSLTEGEK